MSELTLDSLILNQNEVKVDESYLEKNKNQPDCAQDSLSLDPQSKPLSSKDIKINRNFLANRKKTTSPRSTNNFNSTTTFKSKDSEANQRLYKIGIRVDAFEENMRRLEARYGKQFFKLQEEIFKRKNDSNVIMEDLKKIRSTLDETKQNIGVVLNSISSKNNNN